MKKTKSLWRVSVVTTPEAEDAVTELLGAVSGQPVSSYFDIEAGVTTITAYCPQKPPSPAGWRAQIHAGLGQIRDCGLKTGSGKVTVEKMRREDWAESWKRHFKPFEVEFENRRGELCEPQIPSRKSGHRGSGTRVTRPSDGRSLLVKPSWSKKPPRKNQAVVVLDPGLSFGTGQHPTTAFCLREIVAVVCDRRNWRSQSAATTKSFLDMGTGSGILAIAAAKLGYSPVYALDFDPEAVRVARANARANGVHGKLRIVRKDVTKLPVHPVRQYDLICANLISTLLISERRRMVAQLHRGGTLVLAGILTREFSQVQKAFGKSGLKLAARKIENEWCSGSFCFAKTSRKKF